MFRPISDCVSVKVFVNKRVLKPEERFNDLESQESSDIEMPIMPMFPEPLKEV